MRSNQGKGSPALSRRGVLKLGAAAAAIPFAGACAATPQGREAAAKGDGRPRNIIFMVADGLSPGVPAQAELFSHMVRGRGTQWAALAASDSVVQGQFDMASLNSPVTDSAAAASAWATGTRICNWALNTLPDGRTLTPIGVLAKRSGRAVGLVTTTRLTHATPAAFVAAVPVRDANEQDIPPQYLEVADVLLGGGMQTFDRAKRRDKRDMVAEFRQRGYAIARSRDDLLKWRGSRMIGIFDDNHLPYSIDRNREAAIQQRVPTLVEMTQSALNALSNNQEGFLLQVEGGRVDHAAHNNDAAAMLHDQLAFDDAIALVIEYCSTNPDTLVIITSDHACGNPALNGMGTHYERAGEFFDKLPLASASFDAIERRLHAAAQANKPIDADAVLDAIHWGTGLEISREDGATIAAVLHGEPAPEINLQEANIYGIVGQILGNQTGMAWTGIAHTSDWVPLLALGPGSERFRSLLKNTDAYDHMTALWGIEHRNPRMSVEEAMRHAAAFRNHLDRERSERPHPARAGV